MAQKVTVAAIEKALAAEKDALAKLAEKREEVMAAVEKEYEALLARRDKIVAEMDALTAELAALQGGSTADSAPAKPAGKSEKSAPKKKARKAAKGSKTSKSGGLTLAEAISQVLKASDKPMRAKEIAAGVLKIGYKTKSADPSNMVSAILGQRPEFVRVDKGLYTVK